MLASRKRVKEKHAAHAVAKRLGKAQCSHRLGLIGEEDVR